jgi:hypothetical protein
MPASSASHLATCDFCGLTYPELALGDHYLICPETPLAQAEREVMLSWVVAARMDDVATGDWEFSDQVWSLVYEAASRVDVRQSPYDLGPIADVFEEQRLLLSAVDFAFLYLAGANQLDEAGADLPSEIAADRRRAPVLSAIQAALGDLVITHLEDAE